jgi:hypothetical protein
MRAVCDRLVPAENVKPSTAAPSQFTEAVPMPGHQSNRLPQRNGLQSSSDFVRYPGLGKSSTACLRRRQAADPGFPPPIPSCWGEAGITWLGPPLPH